MKILIVGSGGREHAIAASAAKSSQVDEIYCAPGNAGIAQIAQCVDIAAMEFDKLADFAEAEDIGLTIIGMVQERMRRSSRDPRLFLRIL